MTENKKPKGKNRKMYIALTLVLVYVLMQVLPYKGFDDSTKFKIAQGERPLVISHGGAKLLYPENTVMAFEESYNMGVDVLETDICITKDDILVTHHDLTIDRCSNGSGELISYTYDELLQYNFGYNFLSIDGDYPYKEDNDIAREKLIPMSIEQMFTQFGDDVMYILELKDGGEAGIKAADELNRLISEYSLEEYVCVASFHAEVMEHFNSIKHEDVDISMDLSTATNFVIVNYLGVGIFFSHEQAGLQLPPSMYNIPLDLSYLVYKIHHNNMFVHYWTINEKEEMRELIERGADGIITDRPDILFELLTEMGY